MSSSTDSTQSTSLVRTTLVAALSVAVLSVVAGTWLAGSELDTGSLARLAAAQADAQDPVTTGSIGRHANASRLDPCAVPRR